MTTGQHIPVSVLPGGQRQPARKNALRLADGVETLIVGHHLLRDEQGLDWLENLSKAVGRKIFCAADFMRKPRFLLEAGRCELYATLPAAGSGKNSI
jgi:predicted metallo-beta-lactamase superfamily hydrolase